MFSMIVPPMSDCFMPTLGAAQIVGFLKKENCGYGKIAVDSDGQFVFAQV